MGLDKVKQEILDAARTDAAAIIDQAHAEAKAVLKSAEKQAEDKARALDDEMNTIAESLKRREMAAAELELQKHMLAEKSSLIEQVFADGKKKLAALPEKARETHLRRLLEAARKDLAVGTVYCTGKDVRLLDSISGGKLKIMKNDAMSGGLVAETADGKLRVDYSYDTMLGQARSKVLSDVAKTLFGK